jgi:Transposase IS116/IS110/IS902 family
MLPAVDFPGVGHLTALAFTAAVDDPDRFRRSRDLGAYLGLVPRRFQSGEVDYTGGISKGGGRGYERCPMRANVMLTRYRGTLKLKDWALAIARLSRCARRGSRSPGGSPSSCMRCCGTGPCSRPHNGLETNKTGDRIELPSGASRLISTS